jgi:hypothetical protein
MYLLLLRGGSDKTERFPSFRRMQIGLPQPSQRPLWQSKRCLRTAQDNYALDNAFALIGGHLSR